MPFTPQVYDDFVMQELSQLTECQLDQLDHEYPERGDWLKMFVLNRIFRNPIDSGRAALAFAFIRRAEAAITDYEEARTHLGRFLETRSMTPYFLALRRFESTTAMSYQALDIARKALGMELFTRGDGTVNQRLNSIYNGSRHFNPLELPDGRLHPVWLRNDGLWTEADHLTFTELHSVVRNIGSTAQKMAKGERPFAATDSSQEPTQPR